MVLSLALLVACGTPANPPTSPFEAGGEWYWRLDLPGATESFGYATLVADDGGGETPSDVVWSGPLRPCDLATASCPADGSVARLARVPGDAGGTGWRLQFASAQGSSLLDALDADGSVEPVAEIPPMFVGSGVWDPDGGAAPVRVCAIRLSEIPAAGLRTTAVECAF